jgi:hypothetical protein
VRAGALSTAVVLNYVGYGRSYVPVSATVTLVYLVSDTGIWYVPSRLLMVAYGTRYR